MTVFVHAVAGQGETAGEGAAHIGCGPCDRGVRRGGEVKSIFSCSVQYIDKIVYAAVSFHRGRSSNADT